MKSWLVWIALAALLVGCSSAREPSDTGTGSSASDSAPIQVAVIPKGTSHVFWKSVESGAKQAAEELGVDVIWKGPFNEDNKDEQIKVVEDFITKGVSGIALAPLDDTALRVPVRDAQTAGIPVLIFDSALKDADVVSFVATDNRAAGRSGGEKLASLMGGKGKVIILRYQEGSASTNEREEGFLEAMKANPDIEVVSDNQYGGATVESAQAKSESLVGRFRIGETLTVDGIFCPNESTTFGMLRALQNAGFAGKVKFVGFDSSDQLVKGLEDGQIDALVVQNPVKMGYLAVKNLVDHIRGNKVEPRIDTGAAVVDKAALADPEIAALVKPKS